MHSGIDSEWDRPDTGGHSMPREAPRGRANISMEAAGTIYVNWTDLTLASLVAFSWVRYGP